MMRTHFKPRTHHMDAYGFGDTVGMMIRVNGRDLLDRHTAALPLETPPQTTRRVARKPVRRLSDVEIAERSHYARLAAKVA